MDDLFNRTIDTLLRVLDTVSSEVRLKLFKKLKGKFCQYCGNKQKEGERCKCTEVANTDYNC